MDTPLRALIAEPFSKEAIEELRNSPLLDCFYAPGITDEELTWSIGDFQILIVRGSRRIDARQILAASCLRYILVAATTADKIDIKATALKGIEVLCAPGVSFEATAELAFANTVNLLR